MTRWGFIADVHGNLTALQRAIDQLGAHRVDHLVYLGDLLGNGDADACVELVRATATYSVIGNRDRDWADRVAPASRAYVLALPSLISASDFVAVHGDPRLHPALNTADPPRGLIRTYPWLRQHGRRIAFWGHSHHARVWRKAGPDASVEQLRGARAELPDQPETVYVVNVGTTGLPFPAKGPPCCALYDDRERWVELLPLGAGRGRPRELND
jgi:predicted phosphodiesterase